jgi:vanillate O-demethylase ferredoxin subunit
MTDLKLRIVRKIVEADDIYSFELRSDDGRPLPAFAAGSHIDIKTPAGPVRQYSLCNNPSERDRYHIAVLRDPASRGGSRSLADEVNEGDLVEVSQPRNHFPLHQAQESLLLAGGIGITPILCMAERLQDIGSDFALHYCGRSARRMAFLDRIRSSPFASRATPHFDDQGKEQLLNPSVVLAGPTPGKHLYVCGPTPFMDWVIDSAKALGWADSNIHREYFSADVIDTSQDSAFEIQIASSGDVFEVPADRRVTDVLEDEGYFVAVSCEEGVCGTCLTRVIEGEVDHRDKYLDDAAHQSNEVFTPCVSRARCKRLVLDL